MGKQLTEEEKYRSKDYVTIPVWRSVVQFWSPIVAMFAFVVWGVKKDQLTFDNQEQKYKTIIHTVDESKHVNSSLKVKLDIVIKEQEFFKNKQQVAKKDREVIKETQIKIGSDLKEVKTLLRRLDK